MVYITSYVTTPVVRQSKKEDVTMALMAPAQAPRVVLTATNAATDPLSLLEM